MAGGQVVEHMLQAAGGGQPMADRVAVATEAPAQFPALCRLGLLDRAGDLLGTLDLAGHRDLRHFRFGPDSVTVQVVAVAWRQPSQPAKTEPDEWLSVSSTVDPSSNSASHGSVPQPIPLRLLVTVPCPLPPL
jgi:hypothetical protein